MLGRTPKAAKLLSEQTTNQVVFLIDEVESHLHPKWQRQIIPALLNVTKSLIAGAEVQLLAVTHSPLVMASVEPIFNDTLDAWFDLDLVATPNDQPPTVEFKKRPFIRHGDASRWLMSEAFDLGSARSLDSERVLKEAAVILSEQVIDHEKLKHWMPSYAACLGTPIPSGFVGAMSAKSRGGCNDSCAGSIGTHSVRC